MSSTARRHPLAHISPSALVVTWAIAGLAPPALGSDRGAVDPDEPLVDATEIVPDLVVDLRYATEDNFVGERMYPEDARCLLRRSVADRLARVQARLAEEGFRLKVWDCYRPISVQERLWEKKPVPGLVANPATGGNHNRGAAVDATLVTADGEPVEMPTGFDEFVPEARIDVDAGISPEAHDHRYILHRAMAAEGFTPIRREWWHFNAPNARAYPVADAPLVER